MRYLLVLAAFVFLTNAADASDNFTCDPPSRDIGNGVVVFAGNTTSSNVRSGSTGDLCVQIRHKDIVLKLKCYRADLSRPSHLYQCINPVQCFMGGVFYGGVRKRVDGKNDQVCIRFHNSSPVTQKASVTYFLR
jgi:hypothetical protein